MDLMYFQEQLSKNPEKDSGREEFLFNESIQFSNIDFAYDKEKKLFDNLASLFKFFFLVRILIFM